MTENIENKWKHATDLKELIESYLKREDLQTRFTIGKQQSIAPAGLTLHSSLERLAEDALLNELQRGYRVAYGIPFREEKRGRIIQIPLPFWLDASFSENYAEAHDYIYDHEPIEDPKYRKFYSVRIFASRLENAQSPKPPKGKKGRPKAEGIEEAIEFLNEADPKFSKLTRPRQCDAVREHIFQCDVDHTNPPKNYKDGAINKRLRKLLPS